MNDSIWENLHIKALQIKGLPGSEQDRRKDDGRGKLRRGEGVEGICREGMIGEVYFSDVVSM